MLRGSSFKKSWKERKWSIDNAFKGFLPPPPPTKKKELEKWGYRIVM